MLRLTYFCLFLFLATRIIYGQELLSPCSCNQPDLDFAIGINFLYYKCNNETPATNSYPITAPKDLLDVLDGNKRTIFYIFGHIQNPYVSYVEIIMQALCYGNTDNIVLLDWSKYTTSSYETAFINAEKTGRLFAHSLQLLVNGGLDETSIYIIGHSLGAHLAGIAGKCTKPMFTIPRITGLDPANRLLYPTGCYLSSTDASWIDVIHTDAGGFGTTESLGTAEYYANNGTRPQPGCAYLGISGIVDTICSNQRAIKIYAASKYQPDEFTAVECSSYSSLDNCKNNRKTGVGYVASNVTGTYYFKTGNV